MAYASLFDIKPQSYNGLSSCLNSYALIHPDKPKVVCAWSKIALAVLQATTEAVALLILDDPT